MNEFVRLGQILFLAAAVVLGPFFGLMGMTMMVSAQQAKSDPGAFELRPGVIVAADRKTAYVMNPGGGTKAVNLANGSNVWTTDKIARPLALSKGSLIGQVESKAAGSKLEIATFDVNLRESALPPKSVDLPGNVAVSVDAALSGTFSVWAEMVNEEAIVSWEYTPRYMKGLPPSIEEDELPVQQGAPSARTLSTDAAEVSRGVFSFNVTNQEVSKALPESRSERAGTRALTKQAERLAGVQGVQFLSADGQHILSSKRIGDDTTWTKFHWQVFDRKSGSLVGEFDCHKSVAPFFVTGSLAIFESTPALRKMDKGVTESPLELLAMDLKSGKMAWKTPVRDTDFFGPMPH